MFLKHYGNWPSEPAESISETINYWPEFFTKNLLSKALNSIIYSIINLWSENICSLSPLQ